MNKLKSLAGGQSWSFTKSVGKPKSGMYHITKQTRLYDGYPYIGPSSDGVPMEFYDLELAKISADGLQIRNPVGWNIWEASTGKLVYGFDHFGNETIDSIT